MEIVEERPEERIAWRTLEHAGVPHEGTVRFFSAPGGRGTEMHVELCYTPPIGRAGAAVARLLRRGPDEEVRTGLRRLKQLLETGQLGFTEQPFNFALERTATAMVIACPHALGLAVPLATPVEAHSTHPIATGIVASVKAP